ncbi:radical SAM protein [Desulfococcaceae bacterium HSG7]|nr:radical SAM protein [Desulfococcaceae bacterium HSG7]
MGNLKTNIRKQLWNGYTLLESKRHLLTYFFWECTLQCNLFCRHCGSDCRKSTADTELADDVVLSVFEDISNHYCPEKILVAVTGGEPLVRKNLFDIMYQVKKMGFRWGIVTNGFAVTKDIVNNCIESGMSMVSVSLDGDEASHNWLRNHPDAYKNAVNAIQIFRAEKQLQKIDVITCVHYQNIGKLEDIYHTVCDLGANSWRLFTIFPKGRALKHPDIIVNASILEQTLRFIQTVRAEDQKLKISYCEEGYLGDDWECNVRDMPFFCSAGINIGGLLNDGSFSACPSLSREWIQGHANESRFSDVWENRYQNMRNRNWMKTGECAQCKQWRHCKGSSLHLWDWCKHKPEICHFNMLNRI